MCQSPHNCYVSTWATPCFPSTGKDACLSFNGVYYTQSGEIYYSEGKQNKPNSTPDQNEDVESEEEGDGETQDGQSTPLTDNAYDAGKLRIFFL